MEDAVAIVENATGPTNRISAGSQLQAVFDAGESPTDADVHRLVPALIEWLKSNNFKISSLSLDFLNNIVDMAPQACSPYIADLVVTIREKTLSDSHDPVREHSIVLIMKLMDVSSPQEVWDHVSAGLKHRTPRVRQCTLIVLEQSVNQYGQAAIKISTHMPTLGKMLSDRDENVREATMTTLMEVYRQVGPRVKRDISKMDGIPPAKLTALFERFDQVAPVSPTEDSPKRTKVSSGGPGSRRGTGAGRPPSTQSSSSSSSAPPRQSTGGVSIDEFTESMYSETPECCGSPAALEAEFIEIRKLVSDDRAPWEKRVAKCKRLRALVMGDATTMSNFNTLVHDSASTLASGCKDLRSAVSKETCITVAHLSETMGNKFESVAKVIIPVLFKQTMINVKVLAESAELAVMHVFRTCQSPRLLGILDSTKSEKAVSLRRVAYASLSLVLDVWDADILKKQLSCISDLIFVGQSDADSVVRQKARSSYWVFASIFPTQAASIMGRLDQSKIKQLKKDQPGEVAAVKKAEERVSNRKTVYAPRKASSPEKPTDDDPVVSRRSPVQRADKGLNSSGPLRVTVNKTPSYNNNNTTNNNTNNNTTNSTNANTHTHNNGNTNNNSNNGGHSNQLPQRVGNPVRHTPSATRQSTNTHSVHTGPRRVAPGSTQANKAQTTTSSTTSGSTTTPSTPAATTTTARRVLSKVPQVVTKQVSMSHKLADAIALSKSNSIDMRLEAATSIVEVLKSFNKLDETDVLDLSDHVILQLGEKNTRVCAANMDVLCDLIILCKQQLDLSWVRQCTGGLIAKAGDDIAPNVQEKVIYALGLIRGSFDPELQMLGIFGVLANHSQLQSLDSKMTMMEHMEFLLPEYDSKALHKAYSHNALDCLSGIQRIGEFATSKHTDLRKCAGRNLISLFKVDRTMFNELLSRLPQTSLNLMRKALNLALPTWEMELGVSKNPTKSKMTIQRSSTEAFAELISMGADLGLDDDMQMDNPNNDGSDDYNPTAYQDNNNAGYHDDEHDGYNRGQRVDKLPADFIESNNNNTNTNNSSTNSIINNGIINNNNNNNNNTGNHTNNNNNNNSNNSSNNNTGEFNFGIPDVGDVGGDDDDNEQPRSELDLAVASVVISYNNGARDIETVEAMLQLFLRASKEDDAIWDVHFDSVLEIILDQMQNEESPQIRDQSLRNLRQMLKSQTRYFGDATEVVVRKLLERHQETERDVLRSAEETLSVLSSTLEAFDCAMILKPIILSEDGAVLLAAIKLLTKILKKLSPSEMTQLVEHIIPGLIKGYKHALAEVRKGVVFALVEMHLILGDDLKPHLSALSSSQTKLLGIYIKRAEDKLAKP